MDHTRKDQIANEFGFADRLGASVDAGSVLTNRHDSLPSRTRSAARSTASMMFQYPVHRQRLLERCCRISSRLGSGFSSSSTLVERSCQRCRNRTEWPIRRRRPAAPDRGRHLRESLDGRDLFAVGLIGKRAAGADRQPIEQNGARSANLGIARALGALEIEIVTQEIEQHAARFDRPVDRTAVDRVSIVIWVCNAVSDIVSVLMPGALSLDRRPLRPPSE